MPHYFFITRDGDEVTEDRVGIDCTDDAAAVEMGLEGLADLAREKIPGSTRRTIRMEIVGEEGRHIVATATLDLNVQSNR